tara:strand:+ start:318 stop:836 length:519 start_codon:yes stop_codon:yes gene_type:complete
MDREDISIVASGDTWLGSGSARPIESALMETIRGATKTVEMTMAYSYKARAFANNIWKALDDAASSGVRVYLIINSFEKQEDYERVEPQIRTMAKDHPRHFKAVSFNSEEGILHAKITVVDREVAIISSSNHSDAGYSKNHEMGVIVSDTRIASTASDMFRDLLRSEHCSEI